MSDDRCTESVPTKGMMCHWHRCELKAVEGGKCHVHCDSAVKRREEKSRQRWEQKQRLDPVGRLLREVERKDELIRELVAALDEVTASLQTMLGDEEWNEDHQHDRIVGLAAIDGADAALAKARAVMGESNGRGE